MLDADKIPFTELISDMYSFWRKDSTPFAIKMWWNAMQAYDFVAVSEAIGRHCLNPDAGQFMPWPADVVKMLDGTTADSALQAWAKVDRALRVVGTWRSVIFDDPLIHRSIMEMGGWVDLGNKDDKEWPFIKNEFVTRYRGYKMRHEVVEYPGTLAGIIESQNNKSGFASDTPIMIGNPRECMIVARQGSGNQMIQITQTSKKAVDIAKLSYP